MIYLDYETEDEAESINNAFKIVDEYYSNLEEVPDYQNEKEGMEKLRGVLDGVKSDTFYPSAIEKAAYLLIQINKGHFFSNGNKRLAIVISLVFLIINDYDIKDLSVDIYKTKFKKLFPAFKDAKAFKDFSSIDFACYNLSVVVADSHKYVDNFDDLKNKILEFLKFFTIKLKK